MTNTDLKILQDFIMANPFFNSEMSVVLHSPCIEQIEAFALAFEKVDVISSENWLLPNESEIKTDILFFGNVLHYIAEPKEAIKSCLKSCKYLLIQDLIYRDRSGTGKEFCNDGDCMRYKYLTDEPRVKGFDLTDYNPIFYLSYMDEESDSKHFLMLLKS